MNQRTITKLKEQTGKSNSNTMSLLFLMILTMLPIIGIIMFFAKSPRFSRVKLCLMLAIVFAWGILTALLLWPIAL